MEKEIEVDFQLKPFDVSPKSARFFHYNPNSNQNHSRIVYQNPLSPLQCSLLFHFSFQMTTIADFRMNLLEINVKRKYLLIATDQKVQLFPFDRMNLDFAKPQTFIETSEMVNQIKLMKADNGDDILLVLDNSGLLYAKKVSLVKKVIQEEPVKTFNCKVNYNDNSIWSVDCNYPYIIIGGNHRCVMVFDYNEEGTSQEQSKSIIYEGNDHNIPCVSISECGLFICSNSIDSHVKIFDFNKGTLLLKVLNANKDWGWGVQFIKKNLFSFTPTTFANENDTNQVINMLGLSNSSKTNKVKLSPLNSINQLTLSPYDSFLEHNLVNKYYLLSSCQERASLYEIIWENSSLVARSIGKIELLRNCIKEKYKDVAQLDVYSIFMIKNMMKYSRYEFIHIAEMMRLLIFANKNGDLQVYPLAIDIDAVNGKVGVRDQPAIIIDCNERVAGMRVEDKGEQCLEIYVLTLSGMLYCYQIIKAEGLNNIEDLC